MIVEERTYHIQTGKLPEIVRLYADEGVAIQWNRILVPTAFSPIR